MFTVMLSTPWRLLTSILMAISMFCLIEGSHEDLATEECNVILDFTGVGFKNLPNGFIKNKYVTHLTLDENEISSVSSETFSLIPRLSYLSLAKNKLETLNLHSFSELDELDTLVLSENCKAGKIIPSPPPRHRYRNDYRDYIDYHDLFDESTMAPQYEIDDSCRLHFDSNLRRLTHLFAENNDLKKLIFASGGLPMLTHLYLSHNPLELSQGTMHNLGKFVPALTHIYLRDCGITEVHAIWLPTVKFLYLDDNKIESICNRHCQDLFLSLQNAPGPD